MSLKSLCQLRHLPLAGLLLTTVACNSRATLEEEQQQAYESAEASPLEVIDYYPARDVPGVPRNIQPYFFFNRPVDETLPLALQFQQVQGNPVMFASQLDFDGAGMRFVSSSGLAFSGDVQANFELSLLEDTRVVLDGSEFSSVFPEGMLFNMTTGLSVEKFGSGVSQPHMLQAFFTPGVYPLWILCVEGLTSETTFPAVLNYYLGPAYIREDGTYRIYRHVGFSTIFRQVYVDASGTFQTEPENEFLPLDTPDQVVPTWMAQLQIEGRLLLSAEEGKAEEGKIEDFQLTGIMPARSLLLLAAASDNYASAINTLHLDVDLNGNGIEDAATFAVKSQPVSISPSLWNP
ncbi:MAG: hypothetical protein ACKO6N_26390 [Myxococcota bacterium]